MGFVTLASGRMVDVAGMSALTELVEGGDVVVLSGAGLSIHHVVKSTMFLQDMGDFAKVNPLYEAGFEGHKPARSTIQVAKLPWVMGRLSGCGRALIRASRGYESRLLTCITCRVVLRGTY